MSYTLTHLTTELASRPLGLDEARPRFGWRIDSEDRDVLQRAYRVTVSREGEILWDSGQRMPPSVFSSEKSTVGTSTAGRQQGCASSRRAS